MRRTTLYALLCIGLALGARAVTEVELVQVTQESLQPRIDSLDILTAKEISILSNNQMVAYLSGGLFSEKLGMQEYDTLIQRTGESSRGIEFLNSKEGKLILSQYFSHKVPGLSIDNSFPGFTSIHDGVWQTKGSKSVSFSLDTLQKNLAGGMYDGIKLQDDGSLIFNLKPPANDKSGISRQYMVSDSKLFDNGDGFGMDDGSITIKSTGPNGKPLSETYTLNKQFCPDCMFEIVNGKVIASGSSFTLPGIGTLSHDEKISRTQAELLGNGNIKLIGSAVFSDVQNIVYRTDQDTIVSTRDDETLDGKMSRIDIRYHEPDKNGLFINYVKLTPMNEDHIQVSDELIDASAPFPYGLIAVDSKNGKVTVEHEKGTVVFEHQHVKVIQGTGIEGTVFQETGTNQILFGKKFGTYHGTGLATPESIKDSDFIGSIESVHHSPQLQESSGITPAHQSDKPIEGYGLTGKEPFTESEAKQKLQELMASNNIDDLKAAIHLMRRFDPMASNPSGQEFGKDIADIDRRKMERQLGSSIRRMLGKDPAYEEIYRQYQEADDNKDYAAMTLINAQLDGMIESKFGKDIMNELVFATTWGNNREDEMHRGQWTSSYFIMEESDRMNTYREQDPITVQQTILAQVGNGQITSERARTIFLSVMPPEKRSDWEEGLDQISPAYLKEYLETKEGVAIHIANPRARRETYGRQGFDAEAYVKRVREEMNHLKIPLELGTVELSQHNENYGSIQGGDNNRLLLSLDSTGFRELDYESILHSYSAAVTGSSKFNERGPNNAPSSSEIMSYLIDKSKPTLRDQGDRFPDQLGFTNVVEAINNPRNNIQVAVLGRGANGGDNKYVRPLVNVAQALYHHPLDTPVVSPEILAEIRAENVRKDRALAEIRGRMGYHPSN